MISKKQSEFLSAPLPRMTICEGAISSGKTFISNHKAIKHIVTDYTKQGLIFFVGRTLTTLERNVLEPLATQYRGDFKYSLSQKKASLCGIRIDLEGCNDMTAEAKIRGSTAEFIYGDELTLWNRPFLLRCMGSLRTPSATFLGTTNPDSPMNFVRTDYLDRKEELGLRNIKFMMEDNPSLTSEYIEQVSKEYVGVFHDRFIKGLWTLAQGLIYPNAAQSIVPTKAREYAEYQVSCDYGIHNPTCFGLFGRCGEAWYMVKEYYHSGRDTNQPKTDEEYYQELEKFVGGLPVRRVIVDPSASSFITLIRRKGKFVAKPADNSVLNGIRNTATALSNGVVKINDCCTHTRDEFKLYAWDERAQIDAPIKESDHCMDLLRYFVHTNKLALPKWKGLFA